MGGLASDFLTHTDQWNVEPELVRNLMGEVLDTRVPDRKSRSGSAPRVLRWKPWVAMKFPSIV